MNNPIHSNIKVTTVIMQFNSKETPEHVYELHIKDLKEAVTLAEGNTELLRKVQLDLMDALAVVQKLQERDYQNRS